MAVRTFNTDIIDIEYTLRKRRRQRFYTLSVHVNGRVTLTVPKSASIKSAENFLFQKQYWLRKMIHDTPQRYVSEAKQRQHYKKHKEEARQLITKKLQEINSYYGYSYKKVYVRLNRSRWGSCSELGNLNFDYRILFLSSHLQNYLIVHELCHLKEMNHSKNYWALVAQTVPNFKDMRKELQKYNL